MEAFIGKKVYTPTGYAGTLLAMVTDLNGRDQAVVHWTEGPGPSPRNFVDVTDTDDLMVSFRVIKGADGAEELL